MQRFQIIIKFPWLQYMNFETTTYCLSFCTFLEDLDPGGMPQLLTIKQFWLIDSGQHVLACFCGCQNFFIFFGRGVSSTTPLAHNDCQTEAIPPPNFI